MECEYCEIPMDYRPTIHNTMRTKQWECPRCHEQIKEHDPEFVTPDPATEAAVFEANATWSRYTAYGPQPGARVFVESRRNAETWVDWINSEGAVCTVMDAPGGDYVMDEETSSAD